MELFGKALFYCKNVSLLEILDEFLKVTVIKEINEISHEEVDFLFIDPFMEQQEKIIYFCRHYINKNIIVFYCCALEDLENIKTSFDDYISIPFSQTQVKYKLKFWSKKEIKKLTSQNEEVYILEKIEFYLNQAISLADRSPLSFQISSIEWLVKFLTIQRNEITDQFIEEILEFIRSFSNNFNCKVHIKLSFPIQSIAIHHQRNLLQVLLCLSRVCYIYGKAVIIVKCSEKELSIFLNKKPNLLRDYISCILFKKITDRFKKNWQTQKLDNGTLFKYTLFED